MTCTLVLKVAWLAAESSGWASYGGETLLIEVWLCNAPAAVGHMASINWPLGCCCWLVDRIKLSPITLPVLSDSTRSEGSRK